MWVRTTSRTLLTVALSASACSLGPGEPEPVVQAVGICDVEGVMEYLEGDLDPNAVPKGEVVSVLRLSVGSADGADHCLEVLALLLAAGGDATRVELGDPILVTAAVSARDPRVVRLLVEAGADPCAPLSSDPVGRIRTTSLVELAKRSAAHREVPALVVEEIERVVADC